MATKTLEISLKRPVFLVPGDIIVLNPNKKDLIQIVKKQILAVPLPYNDN
jgi:urease accessory protein UreE